MGIVLRRNARTTQILSKLGIDIAHKDGKELIIRKINDGLVSQWNLENPEKKVIIGDCIFAVNGAEGASPKLVEAILGDEVLDMRLRRVCNSPREFAPIPVEKEVGSKIHAK